MNLQVNLEKLEIEKKNIIALLDNIDFCLLVLFMIIKKQSGSLPQIWIKKKIKTKIRTWNTQI